MVATSTPVTESLLRCGDGDSAARDRLIPLVYDELRWLARQCLAGRHRIHTLQSTPLVHEAYLRLVGDSSLHWNDRVHFLAVAARLMRHVLVDRARMKNAKKRGRECVTLMLDEDVAISQKRELDLVALDDALHSLAALDERPGRIVELRFFAGLSIEEASQVLDVSPPPLNGNGQEQDYGYFAK